VLASLSNGSTKLLALTFMTLGMQMVVLVSTIGLCLELHRINVELSAISDRFGALSERLEQRQR
jgi:hypothetical protein